MHLADLTNEPQNNYKQQWCTKLHTTPQHRMYCITGTWKGLVDMPYCFYILCALTFLAMAIILHNYLEKIRHVHCRWCNTSSALESCGLQTSTNGPLPFMGGRGGKERVWWLTHSQLVHLRALVCHITSSITLASIEFVHASVSVCLVVCVPRNQYWNARFVTSIEFN